MGQTLLNLQNYLRIISKKLVSATHYCIIVENDMYSNYNEMKKIEQRNQFCNIHLRICSFATYIGCKISNFSKLSKVPYPILKDFKIISY